MSRSIPNVIVARFPSTSLRTGLRDSLVALLLLVTALTGCESTPERGEEKQPAVAEAARAAPPPPPRPRGYGAPPFSSPKAKERPSKDDLPPPGEDDEDDEEPDEEPEPVD